MEAGKRSKNISYTKIISVYLWICIIGLIISIPVFNEMINKHDLEISNEMCGLIAEKMNNSIVFITESVTGRAEVLSSSKIDDWNETYRQLVYNQNAEGCNSIGLIDRYGKVYGDISEGKEFIKWGLVGQAKKTQGLFISPPYRQSKSGKMVFTIFATIYQDAERAGELYMTFDLELIQKMANSEILKDNMEIYLMNPFSNNYIRCFCQDSSQIGSWNNTKLLYGQISEVRGKTYSQWLEDMRQGKNGEVIFFRKNDVVYTQVFVNIDVMQDWSVVVCIPNDALSHNLRVFHLAIMAFIVILILMLFVLFILSYRSADNERSKLEYLSIHDPLTSLENRRAFEKNYNEYMSNKFEEQKGALVFFDIDYFKQVNDGFGHAMGDRVLREFADIGKEIFAENGIISRFGGDEFVLLIDELESKEKLEKQLNEFLRKLGELDFLKDEEGKIFKIHFSAGIVEVDGNNGLLEDAERKADQALYDVKKRGRNGFAWYEE